MQEVTCINEATYSNNLTRGKRYDIVGLDEQKKQVRIKGDADRMRWYPLYCFNFNDDPIPLLQTFSIDDPDQIIDSTEVSITFSTGEVRWCLFITPTTLAKSGDYVPDTQIQFHYSNKHLIIINEITSEIIQKTLHYLDTRNKLIECTFPLR